MKRAPELRDLSDRHHRGLVQARRLKIAATGDEANMPEETAEAFLEFWQEGTTYPFPRGGRGTPASPGPLQGGPLGPGARGGDAPSARQDPRARHRVERRG